MSTIEVSKIVNEVSFRINNNEYRKATDRIRKIAALFNKSTNQYAQSMQAGKRMANVQAKSTKDQTRAELKAYRQKQQTLKADNIRYRDQIKNSEQFRKSLQRANSDYLMGNKSFKERSAIIGQLNRQYRQLNQQSSKLGIKGIASRVGGSVAGSMATAGALGAGVVGAGGYAASRGFGAVKAEGQSYESLLISLKNTFGEQATAVSSIIRQIATESGRDLLDTGNQLVNYVSIVKSLGIGVNKAIDMFQKQTNMTASYGMSKDQVGGFQYGLMQTMSSNTLEDFKQTMDWSPQIKADLLKFIKDSLGISQKEFMGNLTNGKYNFKDTWLKFVEASAPRYAKMAQGYKASSMANDARASNAASIALFRVFESSGFKVAMESASKIITSWANLLESNADKVGQIFGNLYTVAQELSNDAFKGMDVWLKEITAQDIKQYFSETKEGLQSFIDVMKRLVSFLDSVLPEQFKQHIQSSKEKDRSKYNSTEYGKAYVEEERRLLNQGFTPNDAAIRAEQFALSASRIIQPPQLSFTPANAPSNYVMRSSQNTQAVPSNFSGKLVLDVEANVKQQGFSDFVDMRIDNNNLQILNMWE